jgi:hypothetical protein
VRRIALGLSRIRPICPSLVNRRSLVFQTAIDAAAHTAYALAMALQRRYRLAKTIGAPEGMVMCLAYQEGAIAAGDLDVDADWNAGELNCGPLVLELRARLKAMPGRVLKVTGAWPKRAGGLGCLVPCHRQRAAQARSALLMDLWASVFGFGGPMLLGERRFRLVSISLSFAGGRLPGANKVALRQKGCLSDSSERLAVTTTRFHSRWHLEPLRR